jgi:predicted N-acetyltransferase YhbS
MAALLSAEGFGDDALDRLTSGYSELRRFSLIAVENGELQGVLIAAFNSWHVFASHVAVAPQSRRQGIGRALVEVLARNAAGASAKGIIVDARLSAVAFFQELEF